MEYRFSQYLSPQIQSILPNPYPNSVLASNYAHNQLYLDTLYTAFSTLTQEHVKTKQQLKRTQEELESLRDQLRSIQYEKQVQIQSKGGVQQQRKLGGIKRKLVKQINCTMAGCQKKYGSITALRAHLRLKHLTNDDNLDFVPL